MSSHEEPLVGVFTTDAGLVIRSWDQGLALMTGIAGEEACGRPLQVVIQDLEGRGLTARFHKVLEQGTVEMLSPAFHHYLIPSPPHTPSRFFITMQQRVTISPLREGEEIRGVLVTLEDVTERLDRERRLAEDLESPDESLRIQAAETLAKGDQRQAERLIRVINDTSWRVRRTAIEGLASHGGETTVAALLQAIRHGHRDLNVLNSALQVLALTEMDLLEPITSFLKGPDAELRAYAALLLGEKKDPRAIPALVQSMSDPDPNVAYSVIEALGKLRALEAVEPLMAIAESGDFFLAFPALDALSRIGYGPSILRIVPLLENEMLRPAVAEALGVLGNDEVVPALAGLLNTPGSPVGVIARALAAIHDRYDRVYQEGKHIADLARQGVTAPGAKALMDYLPQAALEELRPLALVLGWLEGPAMHRALTRLLGQPEASKEVVEAMVRHGSQVVELLMEQLRSEDLEIRQAAVIALGRIGDRRAVSGLIRLLREDMELVPMITGALAKIGDPEAFETLLQLLGHPNSAFRQAAIGALNSIGHPQMGDRISILLTAPDPLVRESAVKIAGYFGYPQCHELLLERCQDPVMNVRRAALANIAYLEDERILPILSKALREEGPGERAAAVRALGHMEAPQAFSHLLEALKDPDPWVRYFAVKSLTRLSAHRVMPPLDHLAQNDPAPQVRLAAAKALGQLGGEEAIPLLALISQNDDLDLALAGISALGRLNHASSLPVLRKALRSANPALRKGAAQALGEQPQSGVSGMLQWVAATDPDEEVSLAAIEALSHRGSAEAVQSLIELTADPKLREAAVDTLSGLGVELMEWLAQGLSAAQVDVRMAVIEALTRMRHPRATEWIFKALDDPEPKVRLAAIDSLAQLGSHIGERRIASLAATDANPEVRKAAKRAMAKR